MKVQLWIEMDEGGRINDHRRKLLSSFKPKHNVITTIEAKNDRSSDSVYLERPHLLEWLPAVTQEVNKGSLQQFNQQ